MQAGASHRDSELPKRVTIRTNGTADSISKAGEQIGRETAAELAPARARQKPVRSQRHVGASSGASKLIRGCLLISRNSVQSIPMTAPKRLAELALDDATDARLVFSGCCTVGKTMAARRSQPEIVLPPLFAVPPWMWQRWCIGTNRSRKRAQVPKMRSTLRAIWFLVPDRFPARQTQPQR